MVDEIYNKEFYDRQLRGSLDSARLLLGYLFASWVPHSVIDIGCGRGTWLAVCKELGAKHLVGLDGPWVTQDMMLDPAIEFRAANLAQETSVGAPYDLALSLEVAEHLPPEASDQFFSTLARASNAVLFSAAFVAQPGTNHINARLHSFWAKKFLAAGYLLFDIFRQEFWNNDKVEPWYRQNAFLYVKPDHPLHHALVKAGHLSCKDAGFVDCIHPWLYFLVLDQLRRPQNSFDIITTCKGRLSHLRQTLPQMVKTGFPVTVVDYACPENTANFVNLNYPGVRVVAVKDRPVFNLADARNLGASGCQGKYLLFVDCDTLLADGFGPYLRNCGLDDDRFYVGGDHDLHGSCLVPRRRFESVGGYDEVIEGWGYEDEDLYWRLQASGLSRCSFDKGLVSSIPHPDILRHGVNQESDKWFSQRINSVYSRAKDEIQSMVRRTLTVGERISIRTAVKDAIKQSLASGTCTFAITVDPVIAVATAEDARNGAYRLERQIVFTLQIPATYGAV